MGVIFVELWTVSIYFLITDGNSLNQLALPFSNTGFFNELRIVSMALSAILSLLSVSLD